MNVSPAWEILGYIFIILTEDEKMSGIATTNITKTVQQIPVYKGSGSGLVILTASCQQLLVVTTEG